MIRHTASVLLMSTVFAAGAAVAQTSPAPTPSTTPMTTPAPAATAPMPASSVSSGAFVVEQGKDQFRASKFIGLDIYGSEGQKIGDISEVLMDGTGNAKAIVIGVGGFLGIGQKNVALPWSAVEWKLERPMTTASTGTVPAAGMAPGTGVAPAAGSGMAGSSVMGAPATTASTVPARSPAEQAAYNGYPDHGMVKMTKAELGDAPAFRYVSDMTSNATTTTAPRQ